MKNIAGMLFILAIVVYAGDDKDHGRIVNHDRLNGAVCELEQGQACENISVPTAQCRMCTAAIEKALKSAKGVEKADFDLEKKSAHIHYSVQTINLEQLEQAITAAGYDANDKKRDETAHNSLPGCCQLKR
ncbi:heavy-metal-associated domain-containing protein [candidate division KSB1 bacterium]|nr:heavy-metal-associated domain-containing protein [candidate division KSB1 bacterium]